jgi:hypothetical protein
MNRKRPFWYLHACQREIVICSFFFEYRYFQSRPEIFANLSNGSQASPAVSAAMNRASDVTSKMVMGGLRNAVASNNASRSGANPNTNNTTVSSFCTRVPVFGWGGLGEGGEVKKDNVQSFRLVLNFSCCSRSDVILFWLNPLGCAFVTCFLRLPLSLPSYRKTR